MLFTSLPFFILLAVTFLLFYLPVLRRWQTLILITASFSFYAWGEPVLLLLLLISIFINAETSYRVLHQTSAGARRLWATVGVSANLVVLLFYKYGPLVAQTLPLDSTDVDSFGHWLVTLPLPIGISFFTFQGISLVVDVYRGDPAATGSLAQLARLEHYKKTIFFKAFFPQLIAGPIMKAHDFLPQIAPKSFGSIPWDKAFSALVIGYFLKMVVADNLKDLTFWIAYPYFLGYSSLTLLALLFGYSMQIFADFCGYSLIAMGLGRLFCYELIENFNFPYISQSLSEFWRRWHISLSTWLREYLYISMGGNRHGNVRTYFNLISTMVLGGLWHGAAWSYAVWGLYHGLGLAIERLILGDPKKAPKVGKTFRPVRALAVFAYVTLGWLLFKLTNFADVPVYLKALATHWHQGMHSTLVAYILLYSLPVIAWHAAYVLREHHRYLFPPWLRPVPYAVAIVLIVINNGAPGAFIYFQF